jgi:hypothetical protein
MLAIIAEATTASAKVVLNVREPNSSGKQQLLTSIDFAGSFQN